MGTQSESPTSLKRQDCARHSKLRPNHTSPSNQTLVRGNIGHSAIRMLSRTWNQVLWRLLRRITPSAPMHLGLSSRVAQQSSTQGYTQQLNSIRERLCGVRVPNVVWSIGRSSCHSIQHTTKTMHKSACAWFDAIGPKCWSHTRRMSSKARVLDGRGREWGRNCRRWR